jgi:hypothetical protein
MQVKHQRNPVFQDHQLDQYAGYFGYGMDVNNTRFQQYRPDQEKMEECIQMHHLHPVVPAIDLFYQVSPEPDVQMNPVFIAEYLVNMMHPPEIPVPHIRFVWKRGYKSYIAHSTGVKMTG